MNILLEIFQRFGTCSMELFSLKIEGLIYNIILFRFLFFSKKKQNSIFSFVLFCSIYKSYAVWLTQILELCMYLHSRNIIGDKQNKLYVSECATSRTFKNTYYYYCYYFGQRRIGFKISIVLSKEPSLFVRSFCYYQRKKMFRDVSKLRTYQMFVPL